MLTQEAKPAKAVCFAQPPIESAESVAVKQEGNTPETEPSTSAKDGESQSKKILQDAQNMATPAAKDDDDEEDEAPKSSGGGKFLFFMGAVCAVGAGAYFYCKKNNIQIDLVKIKSEIESLLKK